MATPKTREKILGTALYLFNTKGSRVITTNHIAKECGISPGTLYYHFKNKEEIIRHIFQQKSEEWTVKVASLQEVNMQIFNDICLFSEYIIQKYKFIYVELYSLCQADEELARMNTVVLQQRKVQSRTILASLIESERLEPLNETKMNFLVESIWFYAIFWQPYQQMLAPGKEESSTMDNINMLFEKFLVKKKDVPQTTSNI